MKAQTIRNIITGYENQLANAEIANDVQQVIFLKAQISEGHKALATIATYND